MNKTIRFRLFLLLCICATGAAAQNLNEQSRLKQEIERQIEVLDKQITSNKELQQATIRELNLLQQKVAARKLLMVNINDQIKQLNDSINIKEKEIKALGEEYDKVEFSYLHVLYKAYTQRSRLIWATHILAGNNLSQAFRRWQYFKNYSRYLNQQTSIIKTANTLLNNEISLLHKLRSDTEELKKVQQTELTTLNQEELQSKKMVTLMLSQEQKLKAQLQEKQKERDALNKEMTRMTTEAEKERKAASSAEIESSKFLSTNFEQNKGKLPWPLNNGVITEPFGQHNHPVLKGIKMPFNNGVGITVNQGDVVRSIFEGVVKQIVFVPIYNQCIMVQHGSYYTFYCKLETINVKVGDKVTAGDVLGSLSKIDGEYTLHFEIWNGSTKQNPEQWLRKR